MATVMSTFFNDIRIGLDCFDHLNLLLNNEYKTSGKFVIVDENTKKYCLPVLLRSLTDVSRLNIIEVPSGEENKNLETCTRVWQSLLNLSVDTDSLIISLGGGAIGDLSGFVAATILRGVDHIQIPTSLLAMVDASVGGKTGINFSGLKNQIGTFTHPRAVYINPNFINTLSNRDINSGLSETLKHALIADSGLWNQFLSNVDMSPIHYEELISRSVEIKNSFVIGDEKDKSSRHALNFGHTIGHSIESFSLVNDKYVIRHGEAIALGMIAESYLSHLILGHPEKDFRKIASYLSDKFKYLELNFLPTDLMSSIYFDKKNKNSEPNFTLIPGIGKVSINHTASEDQILEAIRITLSLFLTKVV